MSGRRNNLKKFQVITEGDSASSLTSTSTDVSSVDNITYQVSIDPSVSGELFVEFCNDQVLKEDSEFKPLNFGEEIILSVANDLDYTLKIVNHGFKWMRLDFVNDSGSGPINAWISGNSVGA